MKNRLFLPGFVAVMVIAALFAWSEKSFVSKSFEKGIQAGT